MFALFCCRVHYYNYYTTVFEYSLSIITSLHLSRVVVAIRPQRFAFVLYSKRNRKSVVTVTDTTKSFLEVLCHNKIDWTFHCIGIQRSL